MEFTVDGRMASSMPSNQSYDESEIVALRAELAAAKAEAVQLRQDLAMALQKMKKMKDVKMKKMKMKKMKKMKDVKMKKMKDVFLNGSGCVLKRSQIGSSRAELQKKTELMEEKMKQEKEPAGAKTQPFFEPPAKKARTDPRNLIGNIQVELAELLRRREVERL